MRLLGIKGRFALLVSTLLCALLALFCWLVYGAVQGQLEDRAASELQQYLQHEWRHFLTHSPHQHGHDSGHETLPNPHVYIEIYDDHNHMLSASVPQSPSWISANHVISLTVQNTHSTENFVLKGWYDPIEISHYLHTLRYILISGCILSILLVIPFSYLLIYSLLSPFRSLATGMENLDVQKLSFRFSEPTIRDEHGSLLKSINKLLSRLEKTFEHTKSFASRASHELRTPLTILRGEVELVLRKKRENEEYVVTLQRVLTQAKKLQDLTAKLLLFADVERLKLLEDVTPIDFEPLLDNCWNGLMMVYPRTDLTIEKMVRHENLKGSIELVECIVKNLLENAIKFGKSKVWVTTETRSNGFRLVIEDDGPGVPTQERTAVLSPFVKLSSTSLPIQSGYGLGLAVVKSAVEAMGGTIQLAQSVLGGLAVDVQLP